MKYIEYRIYLEDNVNEDTIKVVAEQLQDLIIDLVSDEDAPKIFTQDVTYEIKE
jgi:hypothetical protein